MRTLRAWRNRWRFFVYRMSFRGLTHTRAAKKRGFFFSMGRAKSRKWAAHENGWRVFFPICNEQVFLSLSDQERACAVTVGEILPKSGLEVPAKKWQEIPLFGFELPKSGRNNLLLLSKIPSFVVWWEEGFFFGEESGRGERGCIDRSGFPLFSCEENRG